MRRFIGETFERLGGAMIDPDMVLPAALPLDLCGESVRARLCVFTDHNNRDMALRPDLTLPVALAEIALRKRPGQAGESIHRYAARAFRQPIVAGEPMEFEQVGFERFGLSATPELEAETYGLVSEAAVGAGVKTGLARFGDLGVLPAFIDAMGLSPAVNAGLRRAFREAGGVSAYLKLASRPRDAFILSLAGAPKDVVLAKLQDKLGREGLSHFGNRTQDEVVTRLMEQAEDVHAGEVPENAALILEAVLAVNCHPRDAARQLLEIAQTYALDGPRARIDQLAQCFALIEAQAPAFFEEAAFSPAFGRRFTYYDGFVFEIAEPGERMGRPFGAGGRYDRLLADISLGAVSAPAIGGVVRPDRLALAAASGEDKS